MTAACTGKRLLDSEALVEELASQSPSEEFLDVKEDILSQYHWL